MVEPQKDVLVIGASCFGLSTAIHLLQRNGPPSSEHSKYKVTVIDRAPLLPAIDAASTDINKIIRSSYTDPFYAELGQEVIKEWKSRDWGNTYNESGIVVLGTSPAGVVYTDKAFKNDRNLGARVTRLPDRKSIEEQFPGGPTLGSHVSYGYLNQDAGWSSAEYAVRAAIDKVRQLGGQVQDGKEVAEILFKKEGQNRAEGVRLVSGDIIKADIVVVATGAWTGPLLPDNDEGVGDRIVASGQCLATIKLNAAEADRYRKYPIMLDFTGFYVLPPNKDGILKFGMHNAGYRNLQSAPAHAKENKFLVSPPRTILSHPADGLAITREMENEIREGLEGVYPELGSRPFGGTRMCWYTDTPNADFLIDIHPPTRAY